MGEQGVEGILKRWRYDATYLIEMLQEVQKEWRYLPEPMLRQLAERLEVPLGEIHHIGSFYKSFTFAPKGRHQIQICLGTACHVRGAGRVLEAFERELGVKAGQTTKDLEFTLEGVRCLGCCSLAPVVEMDGELYGGVQPSKVPRLLRQIGQQKGKAQKARGKSPAGRIVTSSGRVIASSGAREATPAKAALSKTTDPESAPTFLPAEGTSVEAQSVMLPARSAAELQQRGLSYQQHLDRYKGLLLACTGTGCVSAGAFSLCDALEEELQRQGVAEDYLVLRTGCNGFCAAGPIVVVQPEGIFYQKLKASDLPRLVEEHLRQGQPVEELLYREQIGRASCRERV
jgi:NADH-quinone oxidoreductase subunit E